MHVLLATDADWLVDEVVAALGGPDTSFTVCADGRQVAVVVEAKAAAGENVDIGIFDLQIGSMGGMAVTMSMRLDESSGRLPHVAVLMLLDRVADVHLAKRSGADGWLVKPLDPLRLRRAVRTIARAAARTARASSTAGAACNAPPPRSPAPTPARRPPSSPAWPPGPTSSPPRPADTRLHPSVSCIRVFGAGPPRSTQLGAGNTRMDGDGARGRLGRRYGV